MANLFGLIASVGVVVSLLVAAWQTRELARQTAINNGIAGAAAIYNGIERIQHFESYITAEPWLHAHFYENADLPADENQRVRVLALSRMLADVLTYGLMISILNPEMRGYGGWKNFALEMRSTCPSLVEVVNEHPEWWPALAEHWAANPRSGEGRAATAVGST
ncbi:hypothetical protein QQM39_33120 [Streptomyces sp. DT2A-34]|uniref:hypothetical protein n=1 Tax=Streptomyces sp. DT2A-34 TaxID=3051182 RepID=UPI00265C7DD3|nr:hypothetical protein [Streptomyces sp. DT2A-34]MDO0915488.1 hypothetical protein [Streptomyces sp. DT2A-34]